MEIKYKDVQRKIIYQNVKRARASYEEELAYTEFEGFEIATIHVFKDKTQLWFEPGSKETFKTFKWSGNGAVELLEEYSSCAKAIAGHHKWCQKEANNAKV